MKKNILLIQFRINSLIVRQEEKCILKSLGKEVILSSKNIFKNNVNLPLKDLDKIDGIIIGGSGEFSISKKGKNKDLWGKINKVTPFIKKAIGKGVPILGICFGHQYLAHVLGSKIINDKRQEEVGAFPISLTAHGKKNPLFKHLPANFIVQEGHEDCVEKLPTGAVLLAEGKKCKIQSFHLGNVYGVQFHPELYREQDVKFRANLSSNYMKGKEKINFISCPESKKVLQNFLSTTTKDALTRMI